FFQTNSMRISSFNEFYDASRNKRFSLVAERERYSATERVGKTSGPRIDCVFHKESARISRSVGPPISDFFNAPLSSCLGKTYLQVFCSSEASPIEYHATVEPKMSITAYNRFFVQF